MKKFMTFAAILSLLCLVGCGGKGMPEWINEPPPYPDAIAAVGSAPYSPMTYIMREGAELAGRASVAKVIGTRVDELVKRWAQESHSSSLAGNPAFRTYYESATRALTSRKLAGVRIEKWYYDKDTKTQYALALYSKANIDKVVKEELANVRKKIEEETLIDNKAKAEIAFDELDKMIEKEFGGE